MASNTSSNARSSCLFNNASVQEGINSINPTVFATLDGKNVFVLWEQAQFDQDIQKYFLKLVMIMGNHSIQKLTLATLLEFPDLPKLRLWERTFM